MNAEKFQYSLHINQRAAIELGIESVTQAIIFEYLVKASTWAEPVDMNGEIFHFVARTLTSSQLPLLNLEADTIYRHYKRLKKIGLIEYKKHKGKDCIRVTEKARSYFFGNKSEITTKVSDKNSEIIPSSERETDSKEDNSEQNPNTVGNESDILVNTNKNKTTTTRTEQTLIWHPAIPRSYRPSFVKVSNGHSESHIQDAVDELAGRMDSGETIRNPVGYFKTLLNQIRDKCFVPTYSIDIKESRRKKATAERNMKRFIEESEKSRIRMIEEQGMKPSIARVKY